MHAPRTLFQVGLGIALTLALALSGLTGLSGTATANHDTIEWSRYYATTFNSANDYTPAAYADGRGSLYLVYPTTDAAGKTNLTAAKYALGGASGLPAFQFSAQVNPTLPNVVAIATPSVTTDHDGNLYVAWYDTSYNVYVSKSADGGASWGAPARVDPPAAASWGWAPVITAVPDGTLYVVWHEWWFPTAFQNITIAKSTDRGTTWIAKTNITAYGTAQFFSHALASDGSGRLYVAYASVNWPIARVNFTWSDDGARWSSPAVLNGGQQAFSPSLAVDARGRVHVAWVDERRSVNGYETIWYRRSDSRGASWTMEMPISQGLYATGVSSSPPVSVHGDTVLVGWYVFGGGQPASFAYAVSADGGDLWYPEDRVDVQTPTYLASITSDENGTLYAGVYAWNEFLSAYDVGYMIWDGPPSAPAITGIARGTDRLTVTWSPSPEGDVAGYRLWRSSDGISYELVGTFGATTTTYADPGLSNGTYWYRVTSFDVRGTSSHASDPTSATVGKTTEERIADLEAEIAALQAQLNGAQTDIDAIQSQLTQLQSDLSNLEQETGTQYTDLRSQLNDLQSRLDAIQAEKATQAQSYLNTILLIVVIVLLVFMLIQSRKMRAMRAPMPPPMPPRIPPPSPPPEMPPSGASTPPTEPSMQPTLPEDDL